MDCGKAGYPMSREQDWSTWEVSLEGSTGVNPRWGGGGGGNIYPNFLARGGRFVRSSPKICHAVKRIVCVKKEGNLVCLYIFCLFGSGGSIKITTWQEVQATSAEYERSTKMHGAFGR